MSRAVDHQARRALVAEAVWDVLEHGGVDSLTVREVARKAGVSTGMLAHYFSSKDELVTYAMRLSFDRLGERAAVANEQEPALAALRAICMETLPLDDDRRTDAHAWLFFWGRAATDTMLAGEHHERYRRWRCSIEAVIERGRADGSIRADRDPINEAELLSAFLDGLSVHATLEPDRLDSEHLGALLDDYLERLTPPPEPPPAES